MIFDATGLLQPQIKHAEFLADALNTHGIAADLSGTGTGKTFVGSAVLRHLKRKFISFARNLTFQNGNWFLISLAYLLN